MLRDHIDELDPRERDIIMQRYGMNGEKPKTLEEVAKYLGRTRERVRQIQAVALSKLRRYALKNRK